MNIDLSIITYNSERWITAFFDSLDTQSYPKEFIHIHITDNGSTDRSIELLKLQEMRRGYASFNIYQSSNTGFGSAHNNNVSKSASPFILAANVDLTFEPESISVLMNKAMSDSTQTATWEMRQKPFEHPKHYNPITLETSWSSSACLLIRRSAFEAISGYDDTFFMYGEDVDLSWRLRAKGFELRYVPDSVCWHHTYSEGKFKKIQFLGSLLGNLYLRARFGTEEEILEGEREYLAVIERGDVDYEGQAHDLKKNFSVYKSNFDHFRTPNYKNLSVKKFVGVWDYESIRDGAYLELSSIAESATPLVSVLIRTYQGREKLLRCAIQSVLNQTYKNFEVIVVEDGGQTLKDCVDHLNADNKIRFISAEKIGRCGTGNLALKASKGEYISFLDDDDSYYADHLETLLCELQKHPSCALAYASSFELPMDIAESLSNPENFDITDGARHHRESFNHLTLLQANLFPIQAALFKKDLFWLCGGFSKALDNLEDWNLWTKFSTCTSFLHVPKTTSIFKVPANERIAKERSAVLNQYYPEALRAQDHMYFTEVCVARMRSDHVALISERQSKIDALNEVIADLRGHVVERLRHQTALDTHVFELEKSLAQSRQQIEILMNSTSWKLTRPLRTIIAWLRGK